MTDAGAIDFHFYGGYAATPPQAIVFNFGVERPAFNFPPSIADAMFVIPENRPAAYVVGTLLASDPDVDQLLYYEISAGNALGAWTIDQAGQLKVADASLIDFERYPSWTLTVRVTDNGSPAASAQATVRIDITDINEAPLIANQTLRVDENAPVGTLVGTVLASDVDAGDAIALTITGGNAGDTFALDALTGELTVADNTFLDYEVRRSMALTVRATDSHGLYAEAIVTVQIDDVFDVVLRDLYAQARVTWREAHAGAVEAAAMFQRQALLAGTAHAATREADALAGSFQVVYGHQALQAGATALSLRQSAPALADGAAAVWSHVTSLKGGSAAAWSQALQAQIGAADLVYGGGLYARQWADLHWGAAPADLRSAQAPWSHTSLPAHSTRATWQDAILPPYKHITVIIVPPYVRPPAPPCYTPTNPAAIAFGFGAAWTPTSADAIDFNFTCEPPRYVITPESAVVENTLSAVLLPGRELLHITDVSIDSDRESRFRSGQITFADHDSLFAALPVNGEPRVVEINLNGYLFHALVENHAERRSWNSVSRSMRWRSPAALLEAPYSAQRAYTNPIALTAHQLAERELEGTGWALDWRGEDWLVAAGALSYGALTPLAAIQRIAATAGYVVSSLPDQQVIVVQSRYPQPPWLWASVTPALVLDGDSAYTLSRENRPGMGYQGVTLVGTRTGNCAIVKFGGGDGSPPAEQISDELFTATTPMRLRGIDVLAQAEDCELFSVEVPLPPAPAAPGLRVEGELIELVDPVWGTFRAMVNAVGLRAGMEQGDDGDGEVLTVRQVLTLERHV